MSKRPTISDVAKAAGVSRSTASRAMSGTGYVDGKKRAQIEKAANRIGYRGSAIARALRTQRSHTVGILIADISNPLFPKIVKGADEVLSDEGITILLCNTEGEAGKQRDFVSNMLERQADGLILVSQSVEDSVTEMLRSGPPSVFVNRTPDADRFDYVGPDNRSGIDALMNLIYARGHRRIGYISGPKSSSTARERLEAFHHAAARLGVDPRWIEQGEYDYESGRCCGARLLALSDRPTAIVAANDFVAMGVIAKARELGLSIPGDLAVTGYDGAFREPIWDEIFPEFPRLTTIVQPRRKIGAVAARLLLRRMQNPDAPIAHEILPVDLIDGSTT
jgi:LacI family transcriptional regulator